MLKDIKKEDISSIDMKEEIKSEILTCYKIAENAGLEPKLKLHTQIKGAYIKMYIYDENLRRYILEERFKVK